MWEAAGCWLWGLLAVGAAVALAGSAQRHCGSWAQLAARLRSHPLSRQLRAWPSAHRQPNHPARLNPQPPAPTPQESGQVLGVHQGYWFYTVGQRGGIKLPGGPW
jgi:hypothetical protein